MSRYLQGTLPVYCLNCHACQQPTFQCPDFEDAVLRAVTAVFGRHINHHGCVYHLTQASWRQIQQLGLVPLYKNDDDFRVFCGMMDGLAFLPVPDLTNGIHLLRTLCPDDPPEAAELLDYFDSTYISGRLRQQNPAQNQAVRLVLTRSPPVSTSHLERTWCHSQRWCQNQQHVRGLEQQFLQPGRTCPSVYMACHQVVSKGRSYCPYYYPARCRR